MKYNFKLIIIGFLALYIGVTLVFFNFYKSLAIKDTRQEAISIINTILSIRKFMNDIQRPLLQEWMNESGIRLKFDPHILSASYMTQYINDNKLLKKELKYDYKLVSTNPLNPIHKANNFEKKILDDFRKDKTKEYMASLRDDKGSYFYIAIPIERNKASCLKCHGDPNDAPVKMVEMYGTTSGFYEKIGDLRAMITLKIAFNDILRYHKQEFISGGIAMFIVFVIFIIFIYIFWKKDTILKKRNEILFLHQNRLAVMGGMIGNISHQWKQPLAQLSYILININLLNKKKLLSDEKLTDKIKEANEQIAFMSNTINDFKNFFSPSSNVHENSIQEIIDFAKRLLKAQLKKSEITLLVDIKDNFIFKGNSNELVQVFVNIINNAKDEFEKHPAIDKKTIKIETFLKDNKNTITIKNNAGRIKDEYLDKIFEPYFSTKGDLKASGIGLYICKNIINKFDGFIYVDNSEDGVIFTIEF